MAGSPQPEESLITMARILVAEQSLDKTLRQVLDLACAALPGGEGGITLLEREGPRTAVASSAAALRVDQVQYDAEGGGPCLAAYRRQQVFRIDSTPDEPRWPAFSQSAAAAGIKSTLSLPLIVGGDGLVALNIHSREESSFAETDVAFAGTFASYASVALANARVYWRTQQLASQLEEALSTRGSSSRPRASSSPSRAVPPTRRSRCWSRRRSIATSNCAMSPPNRCSGPATRPRTLPQAERACLTRPGMQPPIRAGRATWCPAR